MNSQNIVRARLRTWMKTNQSKEVDMQLDFHFYAVYALCRCCGMAPKHAKTIAYASQHTDDAKYEHALEFENGGRFRQVLSAHKFVDPDVLSKEAQYRIYVPFHFLPGLQGEGFHDKMICRKDSGLAKTMLKKVHELTQKPYAFQRFGIALHVYADTFSHSGFLGLQHPLNDVEDVDVKNESGGGIARLFKKWFREFTEALAPQIGHTEAAHLPDEPFRHWGFAMVQQDCNEERKNWELCTKACKAVYDAIQAFLAQPDMEKYVQGDIIPWKTVSPQCKALFRKKGELEKRCDNWKRAINDSKFGFACQPEDQNLTYDDREWFRKAVKILGVDDQGKERFERLSRFEFSDWKYFHDAAASHRFYVLNELLAPHGIICG